MSFNDFLYQLGWVFKGYELLIILWFVVTQFPKHRWSLFFARHQSLNSLQLHEMHSCFMAAVCFFTVHVFASELDQFILNMIPKLGDKIRLFYLVSMMSFFLFQLMLVCVHRIKGCLFSKATRICLYTSIVHMALLFMQLIARGYFDYHELSMVYVIGGWACNIIAIAALSIYPIRQTLGYFNTQKEQF
ncbi:hypothetical protein PSECIP111951_00422 [Pseudoalteromonas holothuriae]|uniref:Uncharacterized protein n=1 Tax=Pseudoalteromonas holothuriae TaxID=2963714 RepID=A0ABM9GEV3_9GAMM|nr:hypothetical protein [Pseudoalteromonas sp. CIP111951]CAH9051584.1 hypothetical protein PSECIP111951_00422 [Pseudoalteromonas sp. CIP111951]